MSEGADRPLVVNGWRLYAHPLFLDQLDALIAQVDRLKTKDPTGYRGKNATKRLAAINKLAFHDIPTDPGHPAYRQGRTLGDDRKHWFCTKFFQQYRLFFRYHAASRIIVYAWVNDTGSKRAYDSGDDAYRVFAKMLDRGHPPEDWDTLLTEAASESVRFRQIGDEDAPDTR
ncbi:type II toxin-antitoxin system YhaV family toxin [Rhodovibrio salinarum]|uniref:Toxin n=1 Tax=Rhodovibrio salinarum TaxID=1087 RepID=A0A934V1D4_9PROT|nr:type II toxin-antitoxin system YhaV family toxin [Rhodovibrio salinarum]MBK1699312.1 toxin [Rhodovibrio salinarum]